ncbi:MAG: lytic transglycosylase domain-containing protein [Polaromonas sp.]
MRKLPVPLALALLAAFQAAPARADIWRFVDAQGVTHFSDRPIDKRSRLHLRSSPQLASPAASALAPQGSPVMASPSYAAAPRRMTNLDKSQGYQAVKHLLREASDTHGVDYALLQAVIATESGFNPRAMSPKGAVGLMQLIPPTAERYGVRADKDSPIQQKLTDPRTNIGAGSRYLRDLIKMFPGQLELAVAAYNAGEGAVQRAGNRIPNYPETQNYVKNVMQLYSALKLPGSGVSASPGSMASPGRVRVEMSGSKTTWRSSDSATLLARAGLPAQAAELE